MTKFFKQGNDSRCGPIAALNIDSWRGYNVYRDECHLYEKALGWSAKGTTRASFSRWLGQRARRITWKKLKDALLDGKLVAILTKPINPPSQTHGHIYIITELTPSGCIAINLIEGERKSFVTRQMMVGLLKRSHCWIVGKV